MAREQQVAAAAPVLVELRANKLREAAKAAEDVLRGDASNPQARIVRALARYIAEAQQLFDDVRAAGVSVLLAGGRVNDRYLRQALERAEATFAGIDRDLGVAAAAPWVELALCVACIEGDWNRNGEIDERDKQYLEIERAADGAPFDAGDPRRRPTFRFDVGDVHWARAMIAFQRAILSAVLAYKLDAISPGFLPRLRGPGRAEPPHFLVPLHDKAWVTRTKERILEGLDHSDAARAAYLKESDDDREWVPSPRQKDHPLPLPVDDALYATWAGVVSDLRKLVRGEEGIALEDVASLSDARVRLSGVLDLSAWFSAPKDLDLDLAELRARVEAKDDGSKLAAWFFGSALKATMKKSALPERLRRMQSEVKRGEETFAKKLRYLFWIN